MLLWIKLFGRSVDSRDAIYLDDRLPSRLGEIGLILDGKHAGR